MLSNHNFASVSSETDSDVEMNKKINELLEGENEPSERKERELLEDNSNESLEDEVPRGFHRLTRPIPFDGEKKDKIEYDMERITPIQYINLVKRLSKKRSIAVPEVDMEVQISYFALSSGIPVSVLKKYASPSDYAQICGLVRTFLLGASAEELEED